MNEEVLVIRACGDSRQVWEKVTSLRLAPKSLSLVAMHTLTAIGSYYERDAEASSVAWPIVKANVLANHGGTKKQDDSIEAFFAELNECEDVSEKNLLSSLIGLRKRQLRDDLLLAIASSAPNELELLEQYKELHDAGIGALEGGADSDEEEASIFRGDELANFFNEDSDRSRIPLPIVSLNNALGGGPKRKNHMLILARPESGKTALCITLTAGFLRSGLKVLYVTNEEVPEDYIMRTLCCLLQRNEETIRKNWDRAVSAAMARGYGNLVLASLCPGTPKEIVDLVEEYRPDVLVVDQIRNLNMGNASRVENLEDAGKFMRNLARKYDMLSISVTQAGDSADNRLVLTMGDCDNSNTGLPGSTCIMLGLGANSDYLATNRRVITLIKNKVTGDHGSYTVNIKPELSLIE